VGKIEATLKDLEAVLQRDPDPTDVQHTMPELRCMLEDMARDGNLRHDPIREVFARLGDKWSPLLLLLLQMRGFRHATLWRLVGTVAGDGQISQRILRLRLRALEQDGLVMRQAVDSSPPGVLYQLTETGRELAGHIEHLMTWTRKHSEEISRGRRLD
jgi:DNA-binding HxlR family transcriptional regulator